MAIPAPDIGPEVNAAGHHHQASPSSEIPEERIQENALLVPAVVRDELEVAAEHYVGGVADARWLVNHILGVGIEHYRRLTVAVDETWDELERHRDDSLNKLWGTPVLENLPAGAAEIKIEVWRRLDAIQKKAASKKTPLSPDSFIKDHSWEEIGGNDHAAGIPRNRVLLDDAAQIDWFRGWDAAEAASKKTPKGAYVRLEKNGASLFASGDGVTRAIADGWTKK